MNKHTKRQLLREDGGMMRRATFTLRIEGPDDGTLAADNAWAFSTAIQHAEDVVNDALPEGFYCKIDQAVDISGYHPEGKTYDGDPWSTRSEAYDTGRDLRRFGRT